MVALEDEDGLGLRVVRDYVAAPLHKVEGLPDALLFRHEVSDLLLRVNTCDVAEAAVLILAQVLFAHFLKEEASEDQGHLRPDARELHHSVEKNLF